MKTDEFTSLSNPEKTIGERIKARRTQLNMTQEELAQKIGYKSKSSINKIELNIALLKQSKIKIIADALETTPSYIMGWDDYDEKNIYGRNFKYNWR